MLSRRRRAGQIAVGTQVPMEHVLPEKWGGGRPSASNSQDDLSPRILPPTTPVPLDIPPIRRPPHHHLDHHILLPTVIRL